MGRRPKRRAPTRKQVTYFVHHGVSGMRRTSRRKITYMVQRALKQEQRYHIAQLIGETILRLCEGEAKRAKEKTKKRGKR